MTLEDILNLHPDVKRAWGILKSSQEASKAAHELETAAFEHFTHQVSLHLAKRD